MIDHEMIIPEWFFKKKQSPPKIKIKKVYNPKPLTFETDR